MRREVSLKGSNIAQTTANMSDVSVVSFRLRPALHTACHWVHLQPAHGAAPLCRFPVLCTRLKRCGSKFLPDATVLYEATRRHFALNCIYFVLFLFSLLFIPEILSFCCSCLNFNLLPRVLFYALFPFISIFLFIILSLSRRAACGRSPAEMVGSNSTGGMDICLL